MSEDRLDEAIDAMKREDVDAATLAAARARVWSQLPAAAEPGCAEFRQDLPAYISGELGASRRVLTDDHLSRCTACRALFAGMTGERRVTPMPPRFVSRWTRWVSLTAAAAVMVTAVYLGRDAIDAMMAPGGPRATVVAATGELSRVSGGALGAGASIGEGDTIRTGAGAHAVLRLADGSMVDVNEQTELFLSARWSGRAIHLQRGDVIVKAAKQRRGSLRVLTRDSMASVKGTVFAVSAGMGGSVVSVVEGAVAVNQPGREVVLHPGEQAASNPALESSVADAVAWSPSAEEYVALLESFATIERQLSGTPDAMRTSSELLAYLPPGTCIYGAMPNLGGKAGQALALAEQQTAENPVFGAWWQSESGRDLRQVIERLQSVGSLLGNEVAFAVGMRPTGHEAPMVMARVQPGRRAELASALAELFAAADGELARSYSVSDDLMVITNSRANLTWLLSHMGHGANTAFAAAIGERYTRGAGWLIGVDASPIIAMAKGDDAPPVELAAMTGVKHLFLEQRAPMGAEENEVTVAFKGARKGLASWLADSGAGGAAEFLPADAMVAGYLSTREPWQVFRELTAFVSKEQTSVADGLDELDQKLGQGFMENLAKALGTEAAMAVTGFSVDGPSWVLAGLANDSATIDASLQKLAETLNGELAADGKSIQVVVTHDQVGGRAWTALKPTGTPMGVTWTYEGGYLVAGSDRAVVERAIASRNGGSALVWTRAFLDQLPASAGLHPSAFVWIDPKGALGLLAGISKNPAVTRFTSGREPVLVVVDGKDGQIHAASRTRLSGIMMDVLMLEGLTRTTAAPLPESARH